uniref:Uncharacterized protein n=1 Tax=Cucumis melo TaxID=3656 RepID=A0A9I9CFK8_CUCME
MHLLDLTLLLALDLWIPGLLLLPLLPLLHHPLQNMFRSFDGVKAPPLMHHHLNLIDGEATGLIIDHLNRIVGAVMTVDLHLEVQGRCGPHPEFVRVQTTDCGGKYEFLKVKFWCLSGN